VPSDLELQKLFERTPIGMYRSDASGRLLAANPALVAMLGYDTVEEVLALDLNRDVYVDARARAPVLEEYRHTGVVDGSRVQWKTRTGRTLSIQLYGHVVDTTQGLTFDATVIDMTEIDAVEREVVRQREELERTATTLDQVVRQMPTMYWLVDHDMRIVRTGGSVQPILGYPSDKFIGVTLEQVHATEPGSSSPIEPHARALRGEVVEYHTVYRQKELTTTVGPLRSRDGTIVGAIGTSIDVTAIRQLERRMIDAQRAESLGVLAGGLAHDFNNLLVAVLGNADLALREIPAGTPGRSAIENIRQAGLRASELTSQLLAYAGRGGTGTTRVSPAELVDELLRIVGSSIPPGVTVAVEFEGDPTVRADPAQLRQVLLNLIANAREAVGERGAIRVYGQRVHLDGLPHPDDIISAYAGNYVSLEVSDDGPGMTDAVRRRVFEPFFTTKQAGHGLGLAALVGIVRAHGGGLRLTSSPGAGAVFRVLWPAASTAPVRAPSPERAAAKRVLVVDDEDLVRDVLARMIEDLGYAADTAADGPSALAMLDQHEFDAVLVDLSMPRMSGAEVVAAVRKLKPRLPVILCSGFDRDGRGRVDADAFLPKPFRIEVLEETLAKLFA
jgi:two-component system, cell cycle sensor histidine kinase and response regulator CckA